MKDLLQRLIAIACFSICAYPAFSERTEYNLDRGWKFSLGDETGACKPEFDDSNWEDVTIPHDWAINGEFDIKNDPVVAAEEHDGQQVPTFKAGRTGCLPIVGTGWYRLHFDAPAFSEGKCAEFLFDGAMSNAHVYLNGEDLGIWPYGYGSFILNASASLRPNGNVLAVRLENLPEASRWYTGAGLYRNVHLIISEKAHIPIWGVRITTPSICQKHAKIQIQTEMEASAHDNGNFELITRIIDPDNKEAADGKAVLNEYCDNRFSQELFVDSPRLWSPETPLLYHAELSLYRDGILLEKRIIPFGIRKLEIIADKGMFLNGNPIKFKGVCLHHDLGPLGAAINKSALRRQLSILKDMGANAIRTAHNIPAPELIELCDEMGFMVMIETFDEWRQPKMRNGYHLYFDQWAERDLANTIRRYRNNPSVVMWSIGNEIPEQSCFAGAKIARWLRDICHREDPTRPVTMGIDQVENAISNNIAPVLDVVGLNYRTHLYTKAYNELPQQIILGSETASTFSSRGIYHFPVEKTINKANGDHQSSGYDLDCGSWSNLPDDDFIMNDDYDWCIGQFAWTGFDYLGEPTPYNESWPNHSSLFGIVDLAGIPKDRYYLYRSQWNQKDNTLHIVPHWTWPGREGETTPVFVYTSYPSVELIVNGKSAGRMFKDTTVTAQNSADSTEGMSRQRRYRLMWTDVKYEPGSICAIAYDKDDHPVARTEVRTAGKPYKLEVIPDRREIAADGKDLSFITIRVLDRDGNLCPNASPEIHLKVEGAGSFKAAANGDPTCLEPFNSHEMKAFCGQLVAIVQSGHEEGEISFEASAKNLKKTKINISVK